jgi:two-component system, OmpR family, phosphate regulon sensor histidine kinase PhoR
VEWGVLRRQLTHAALAAAAGGLVGLAFDAVWPGICTGLALYLLRQLYYLAALRAWVDRPKRVELPEPRGTWGVIYERLIDLQRRNRKRKKRLVEALQKFQDSTEALPDGAVVLGGQGDLLWFNTAAQALLGLKAQQDMGQRLPNFLRHPAFSEFFARGDFREAVEIPSPENPLVTLSLRIVPYGNNQKLVLVRDVSELKRLDRIRRDFVANASHELRTPLTVLRGYLEMMRGDSTGDLAPWKEPLAQMHAQAARMEALVRDLLKLARLEAEVSGSRSEVLDVPAMLDQVLAETRSLSAGQHRIETEIQPELRLFGQENEIESIFSNLAANAVQYTPTGGSIILRWREDAQGAHFSVTDTGIGIPADDIPRLTERFYRVDAGRSRARGGTGLGLSIVKHALERHEGRLTVESRVGKGSTFTCHFPPHRIARQRPMAANL